MSEQKTGSVRPTLVSLKDEIQDLRLALSAAQEMQHSHPAASDIETSVAGRCARALDELRAAERSRTTDTYALQGSYGTAGGYDYQALYIAPSGPVPRVIDYLRQRYGLPDPAHEARRLSAELERAYQRMRDLEQRLEQIRGATS